MLLCWGGWKCRTWTLCSLTPGLKGLITDILLLAGGSLVVDEPCVFPVLFLEHFPMVV